MSAPHLPPVGPATASDVYTQSQETTVSTLTAFTSIVDLSVVGEEEDLELPPLTSIFHCSMIEESTNSQNGKISWLCKWCGKTFLPRHQSRALCHMLKIRCGDIDICIARIPKFTRIDTVHCMTKVRNEWHQRSAPIHKLMMLFS